MAPKAHSVSWGNITRSVRDSERVRLPVTFTGYFCPTCTEAILSDESVAFPYGKRTHVRCADGPRPRPEHMEHYVGSTA